jgi:hypothetical protein
MAKKEDAGIKVVMDELKKGKQVKLDEDTIVGKNGKNFYASINGVQVKWTKLQAEAAITEAVERNEVEELYNAETLRGM